MAQLKHVAGGAAVDHVVTGAAIDEVAAAAAREVLLPAPPYMNRIILLSNHGDNVGTISVTEIIG